LAPYFSPDMVLRSRPVVPGFIEPCLPSPADHLPSGDGWIHEIKHDGYRLMARRDPAAGVRLLTRNGYDWTARYPLIRQAVDRLRVRSCSTAAIGRLAASTKRARRSRQYALVLVIVRDGRQGALSGHEGPRADARRAASRGSTASG
jgi:hypothetical protein